ncbi:MAG TPA: EboA domain-containing protein [Polyangia bacterium]
MNVRAIEEWFALRLPPDTRVWFSEAVAAARKEGTAGASFAAAWSAAGRRLGRTSAAASEAEATALRASGVPFVPSAVWAQDELGRALFLLAAAEVEGRAPAFAAAVGELFRKGEMREQQAVLRVLPHLPNPDQYTDIAADAVRSNVVSVIEAIACENPYPADHLNDLAFNQLVMKALFNQVSLGRVLGLERRNNAELRRMVEAYASERRAAGRPVPADVALISGGDVAP